MIITVCVVAWIMSGIALTKWGPEWIGKDDHSDWDRGITVIFSPLMFLLTFPFTLLKMLGRAAR